MESLVPIFGIIFLFGAPIAAWIISRALAHQERMEMIRRGFIPPPGGPMPGGPDPWAMKQAAKAAWKYGTPMPPPGVPYVQNGYDPNFYAQCQLRRGITVSFVGLALLIGLSFIGHGEFGPWMLGGLIPLFVGLAQVINALLNGARFGPASGGNPQFGPPPSGYAQPTPPPPPSSADMPPPPAGAPYGWRPGPTPEIQKPVQPPDVR